MRHTVTPDALTNPDASIQEASCSGSGGCSFYGIYQSTSDQSFTNHALPLYRGPGQDYDFIGQLPGGPQIGVDRCMNLWCHVHVGRASGWAFLYALSFGQGPNSIWWPAEARHPGVGGWWW